MTLIQRSLLSIVLCIALVITLLPLIGAVEPASATRGYIHGTITAADYAPNSPPIRGITVFITRADGSYSFLLRTNESGMYQTGTLDDRGVGFTVYANKPDKAGYNSRYESASAENILFATTDVDGETRDFGLHGSSSGTPTPTATPTPSPTATLTPTPTQVTPTATPMSTPTPDGSEDETSDAVEPDSPLEVKEYGWIHGTIRKDDMHSGPVLGGITVRVIRKSDGAVVRTVTSNSQGYFNTGDPKLQDPQKQGMRVEVNPGGAGGYTSSTQDPVYMKGEEGSVSNHMLRSTGTPSSNKVILNVRVTNKQGYLLGGVPVYFWRKDGDSDTVRTGSNRADDANFGIAKLEVERYDGICGDRSKCYNIMANKWDVPDYPQVSGYFNSTEKVNVEPDGPGPEWVYLDLPTSTVTLKGYVSADGKPIKGIVVYLWNHDWKTEYGPVTNDKGEWSQVVPRWVWTDDKVRYDGRFNIVANKPGTKYPYNDLYTTSEEVFNVLPADDTTTVKNLNLQSKYVTLGGKVTDASGRGIPGIYVYFWRQDSNQSFHTMTGASGQYTTQGIARVEKYSGSCGTGSKCFNIAFNKDDKNYPDKPKKSDYETREQSNIAPSYSKDNLNQQLYSGWIYVDGRVSNTTGSYVKDIYVSGKRLDDRASFLVKTNEKGYWITRVEKFSEADHRFTVVANPSDHRNAWYLNSTPEIVQPSGNRTINLKLVVSKVAYTGKVTGPNGKGVPNIPVTFERSDGRVRNYAWTTGEEGRFSIALDSSTDYRDKYTVTANQGGPGYPRNSAYDTPGSQTGSADRNQERYFSLRLVATPTTPPVPTTPPTVVPTITPVQPTPNPSELRVNQAAAMMVSPDELGVAAKVLFPSGNYGNNKREVTIETSLRDRNGNPVKKTFDLTTSTAPGSEWGGQYFRTEYGRTVVNPATPLRINLRDLGVSRFTDDTTITISVTASYGTVSTRPFPTTTTVLLPTILYHGYLGPGIRNWLEVVEIAAYRPTSDFLVEKGYNKADAWTGDDAAELSRKGYSLRRYLTLMDPDMGVTYTTAEEATPDILRRDVDRTVNQAISSSYASRVNLIGHSTGGLVSFYYASVEPSKVARVITVGTPHQGVSEIYNKAFAPEIRSREEAEALLKVQEGAYRGQENTIKWFIPKYTDALQVPPDYVAGRDPSPYFTSTFTFSAKSQVDYHYIYSSSHDDTLQTLVLEKNADGRWYHVKETKTGDGDHTVLAKSASNQGVTARNIHKYPVNIWYRHAVMFRESSVHNAILSALKHAPASPFRDETANDR